MIPATSSHAEFESDRFAAAPTRWPLAPSEQLTFPSQTNTGSMIDVRSEAALGDGRATVDWTALRAPLLTHATWLESPADRSSVNKLLRGNKTVRGFGETSKDALQYFAGRLFEELGAWTDLRGVHYAVDVYRFQSMEEKGVDLIRFELRIPGLPRTVQFEIWKRFDAEVDGLVARASKSLGSAPRGRALRKIAPRFSTVVVPW